MATKYIFVTGGVISSLGKGIFAASLGQLLKLRGQKVTIVKFDPYINVDAGTMSPFQHGEVFVTDDGAETDLDVGHYERFLGQNLSRLNNVTAGQIYWRVINRERAGDYLGGTVQVIPHVTDQIKDSILHAARETEAQVVIVEVGGTVGDIESLPFLEAIRQFSLAQGHQNTMFVHLTLMPYTKTAGEVKTKPTQHSVKELRSIGIQPHMIVCRTDQPLRREVREKISLFCNVPVDMVIESRTRRFLAEVPIALDREGVSNMVAARLGMELGPSNLQQLEEVVERLKSPANGTVTIGLVGKYTKLRDSYISVHESIAHGGIANHVKVQVENISAEDLASAEVDFSQLDGILVPGGFGERGVEGKLEVIRFSRENKVPYLGLCLGMQCAVIEFARGVCGLPSASSTEFDSACPEPVIDIMHDQRTVTQKGGTMRLGLYPMKVLPGTKLFEAYGREIVYERHRHRYEVSNRYRETLKKHGMVLSGLSPDDTYVEAIELPDHPYFVACQYHPEFLSRPAAAHPLFRTFIAASLENRRQKEALGMRQGRPVRRHSDTGEASESTLQ